MVWEERIQEMGHEQESQRRRFGRSRRKIGFGKGRKKEGLPFVKYLLLLQ